jgi:2,3,4,5-tetrahydropyridine-2-carboxylate N-succinyltransferase
LTASTKIIDVTGETPVEMKGFVPARSVVFQVAIPRNFQLEIFRFHAIIIGTRKPSTDLKTSLNNALREYDVAV